MKKLFFNENGTLRTIVIVILVDVIVAAILLSMIKSIYGNYTGNISIRRPTTTTKTVTTIDMCNGCVIDFSRDNFDVNPKQVYLLEDILYLEKVNMKYVKFNISDESLAKMSVVDDKIAIEILDKIGSFTLTATYYEQTTSLKVNITSDKIMDIEFDQDIYYVKVGCTKTLSYEVIPKGYKANNISMKIADESLVGLDEEGNLVGKKLGKTSLTITADNYTKSIPIYVVNTDISIKAKDNFSYKDAKYVTYKKDKELELLIILENTNYGYNDIKYEVIPDSDMVATLEYVKKNSEYPNAYEYMISIKSNVENVKVPEKGATVILSIPDGSKYEFRIEVEQQ